MGQHLVKRWGNLDPRKWIMMCRMMYRSIVEPYFCYCCSVWGCCSSTEKDRLQKLQNRGARMITGSSFTTSALPLIESLGWKTIEELISNKRKVCVFKALNGLAPQYLTELFSRNSHRSLHILRNTSTYLKLPLFKTANDHKCFSFRGVNIGIASQLSPNKP